MRQSLTLIALFFIAAECFADTLSPTPFCAEPTKPLLFSPAYYKDRYNTDVIAYKTCLMDFIAEQEKAIRLHQNAADTALQIWDEFANRNK